MAETILVIDDEPMVVKMLENRLRAKGYGVITALNAEEAITKAQETTPDLIILDVLMPKTFGSEIAQQLKENPSTTKIPIIFLSNVPTEFLSGEEKFAGKAQQVVEGTIYLSKLCSSEELFEAIQKALSQ